MEKLKEISLVAQASLMHSTKAFDALVKAHQGEVRRFFLTQTSGDVPLSDDLAQDTFIKAWMHIGGFRGASAFGTWLYKIAYHVWLDYVRSRHPAEEVDVSEARNLVARQDTGLIDIDLLQALSILNDVERLCLSLQLMEGQRLKDISRITGLPEGTVKSAVSRAKHKMADYLRANGYYGKE